MTKAQFIKVLSQVPDDAIIMSNSGWEIDETDINGVWYSAELNEVHLTIDNEPRGKGRGYSVYRHGSERVFVSIN